MALHSRIRRINEELKATIADIIANEVKDPRLADIMVTVTAVNTTKDLNQAQVFVSMLGTDEETAAAMTALQKSQGYIRHEVASRVTLRYMPELIFKLDETGRNAAHINEILHKIERQNPDAFKAPVEDENPEAGSSAEPEEDADNS